MISHDEACLENPGAKTKPLEGQQQQKHKKFLFLLCYNFLVSVTLSSNKSMHHLSYHWHKGNDTSVFHLILVLKVESPQSVCPAILSAYCFSETGLFYLL